MSGLAQLLHEKGDRVTGSDREESPITELLTGKGISVTIGQKAENLPDGIDLLVYSAALPTDNVERVAARERGIPELSYFEMLGKVSERYRTIAVAGTHGKTTTTGMLAAILKEAGAAPSAIVGSIVRDFGSNYLPGTSDLLVVEACEYQRHFLQISPEVLVITNLEFDHTDYYDDLEDVQDAFRALIKKVPAHGAIVADAEHPNIAPLLEGIEASVIDYMKEPGYPLQLPGEFNGLNAKAAAAAAKVLLPQVQVVSINRALEGFKGTWRRFEHKGQVNGADVYDDYAHHPTAIKETLRALKEKTKGRIFIAFHPHLYSRTRDLLDGFSRAFAGADEVLIAPIYAAREIDDGTISSELLAERVRAEGVSARALPFEEIESVIRSEAKEGDVIMTMGAGDIYKVADALIA
jgi:UDP-N-acetylmuramate--alanine ligase